MSELPEWLTSYRETKDSAIIDEFRPGEGSSLLLSDVGFSNHFNNDGTHVSPSDGGRIFWGTAGLNVNLLQPIDEKAFSRTLSRTLRATNGIRAGEISDEAVDTEEMLRGGLQTALESQVVVFEIEGASRALTHQLVRTRKAAYHQQSMRATWYGDRPNVRFPLSVFNRYDAERGKDVELAWRKALLACWEAYKVACDAGVSYQDARHILPEGTTNYIICEYPLREFLNVYAYRACSGFSWEMVYAMREMGRVLLEAHPFLEPHVKISCEKGPGCSTCKGSGFLWEDGIPADSSEVQRYYSQPVDERTHLELRLCPTCDGTTGRKCHFQGWENVENFCDKPQAKQSNRIFLPNPKYRIGG